MTCSLKGLVIKSTGSWYNVLSQENLYKCRIRGKFKLQGMKLTNPVAVGDEVLFDKSDKEEWTGMITKILPRKNYVVRQSPRQKRHLHLLASNVDQAILIVTIKNPKLKQGFIDRFLLLTEPHDIPVNIIFNKADLLSEEDLELYGFLKDIYESIGYGVHLCSTLNGEGIPTIKEILSNKISLISGQSGVGKSSIVKAIAPEITLSIKDISDYTGKGQHTTTFAEMHQLPFGGAVIDSPGIKALSYNNLEPMDVMHNFREIFALSEGCKYNNCSHRNEPKCRVKEAVENHEIFELRYLNYLQILDEIEDQNYWERIKDY